MYTVVIVIHDAVCISLCIAVLLQQGKGADIGAVFGGSSQTVFGPSGAGHALTQATWLVAAIFFSPSGFLAFASARRLTGSIFRPLLSSGPGPAMPAAHAIPHKAV